MNFKEQLLEMLKPLLKSVLKEFVFPELEKIVQDSPNKIDDAVMAALEPMLKTALDQAIDKI